MNLCLTTPALPLMHFLDALLALLKRSYTLLGYGDNKRSYIVPY